MFFGGMPGMPGMDGFPDGFPGGHPGMGGGGGRGGRGGGPPDTKALYDVLGVEKSASDAEIKKAVSVVLTHRSRLALTPTPCSTPQP